MTAELSSAQFSVASTVLSALCVARRALQGLDDSETALAVMNELARRAQAASTRTKLDRRHTRLARWLATLRGCFPLLRDAEGGPGIGAALASVRILDDFDLKAREAGHTQPQRTHCRMQSRTLTRRLRRAALARLPALRPAAPGHARGRDAT